MTEDIRITAVHSAAPSGWTIRGKRLGDLGGTLSVHTALRPVMALCLGAKITEWPVRVELDESGDVIVAELI